METCKNNDSNKNIQEKLLKIDNEIKKIKDDEKLKMKEFKEDANKIISKLCNDIYYQIKWSDPILPLEQQKYVNNYCNHLATKGSKAIFNDINEIRNWNKKNIIGIYSKVTRNINSLCQKLYLIVAEKDTKISTLLNENILTIEKLSYEKDIIRKNDLLDNFNQITSTTTANNNIMKPEVENKVTSPVKDFQLRSTQKQVLKLEEEKKITEKIQKDLLLELQLYKEKCIEQERKEKERSKIKSVSNTILQQHQQSLSSSVLNNHKDIEKVESLPQINTNNNTVSNIEPIFIIKPKKSSVSPIRKSNNNSNNNNDNNNNNSNNNNKVDNDNSKISMEDGMIQSKEEKDKYAKYLPFTHELQKKINERYNEESYQQILYNFARSDGTIFIQQFIEALDSISIYTTSEHAMKIFRDVGIDNKGSVLVNALMYYLSKTYIKKEYINNNNIEFIWVSELFGTKELSLDIVLTHHAKPNGFIDIGNFYASINLLNIDISRNQAYNIFEQVCILNEDVIVNLKSKESAARLKKGKIHINYIMDYLKKEIPDFKKILKINNINQSYIISKSLPISFNKIENNILNNNIKIDKKNEIKLEKKSIEITLSKINPLKCNNSNNSDKILSNSLPQPINKESSYINDNK